MKTRVDAEKRWLMGPLSPSRREGAVRLKKGRKKKDASGANVCAFY